MSGVRLLARPLGCFDQRAVPEPEARLPLLQRGAEALDEVLVGVGGVELDETDSFRRPGEAQRQLPRDVGLARAGRPLKDDLTLVLEQLLDRAQVPQVEELRLGDRPQVGRGLRHVVRVVHNIRVLFFGKSHSIPQTTDCASRRLLGRSNPRAADSLMTRRRIATYARTASPRPHRAEAWCSLHGRTPCSTPSS